MGRDTWPQRCRQPTPALQASHRSRPILVDLQATVADLPTDLLTLPMRQSNRGSLRRPRLARRGVSCRDVLPLNAVEPAVETGTRPLRVDTVCRQSNVDPGTAHGQGATE